MLWNLHFNYIHSTLHLERGRSSKQRAKELQKVHHRKNIFFYQAALSDESLHLLPSEGVIHWMLRQSGERQRTSREETRPSGAVRPSSSRTGSEWSFSLTWKGCLDDPNLKPHQFSLSTLNWCCSYLFIFQWFLNKSSTLQSWTVTAFIICPPLERQTHLVSLLPLKQLRFY